MPRTLKNKHVFKAKKKDTRVETPLICWSRSFEPRRAIRSEIIGRGERRDGPPIWRTPTPTRKRARFRKPPKISHAPFDAPTDYQNFYVFILCEKRRADAAADVSGAREKRRLDSINRVDNAVRFEFRARHDWLAGHPNDIRVTGRKNFIGILTLYSFYDRSNIERSGGSSGAVFARPIIR